MTKMTLVFKNDYSTSLELIDTLYAFCIYSLSDMSITCNISAESSTIDTPNMHFCIWEKYKNNDLYLDTTIDILSELSDIILESDNDLDPHRFYNMIKDAIGTKDHQVILQLDKEE